MVLKVTLKQIKESEPESKLEVERATNYINGFILRPPSRYVIWLFARLGITANQVSVLAFLSTIVACVFLGLGTYWGMVIGALVAFLELFLDFTDGGLARAINTVSKRGYYIDAMVGHFAALTIPIAVGIGLWVYLNNPIFCILGFTLSTLKAYRVLIATEFVVAYSDWARGTIKPDKKNLLWLIYTLGTNFVNIWRFLLLGFALVDKVEWFLGLFILVTFSESLMALVLILMRTEFTAKAQTLETLKPLLKKSYIEDMLIFTLEDWKINKVDLLNKINRKFKGSKVVVRSSSLSEDSLTVSKAGFYHSELNVDLENSSSLIEAINKVIANYTEGFEKILVQRQTEDILLSGVLFTSELNTNAPYYIINYDDEYKRTDWITSGKDGKLLKIFKNTPPTLLESWTRKLLEAVKEIEGVVTNIPLDIEFAVTNTEDIIIFQVRPLVANVKNEKD